MVDRDHVDRASTTSSISGTRSRRSRSRRPASSSRACRSSSAACEPEALGRDRRTSRASAAPVVDRATSGGPDDRRRRRTIGATPAVALSAANTRSITRVARAPRSLDARGIAVPRSTRSPTGLAHRRLAGTARPPPARRRPRAAARRRAQPGRRRRARVLSCGGTAASRAARVRRDARQGRRRHVARARCRPSSALVVTRASNPRSADPRIARRARRARSRRRCRSRSSRSLGDALEAAWRISPRIVVAGSIFLLGDVHEGARRVVIPFEDLRGVSGCSTFFATRSLLLARALLAAASAARAAAGQAGQRDARSATAAKSPTTRTTGTSSAQVELEHGSDTKIYADEVERTPTTNTRDRDRQRRLRAGQQPHRRRARRVQHRDRLGTFYNASGIASVQPPRQTAPARRRRAAADGRPGHRRLFLRRDGREDRPEEIPDHQRRLHHLRAADAALGSDRRHGRPEHRSLHAAASRRC